MGASSEVEFNLVRLENSICEDKRKTEPCGLAVFDGYISPILFCHKFQNSLGIVYGTFLNYNNDILNNCYKA